MKNKIIMIIASISMLIGCFLLWNWIDSGKHGKEENDFATVNNSYKDAGIVSVIIPAESNTFGYDIYVNGAVIIHQPSRPGLPGNSGFTSEEDAMKVAELVIKKIRNNEMPPTVTIEELRMLGVL